MYLMLVATMMAGPAPAAGIDCAKATTRVEKAICGEADLSALDEMLGSAVFTSRRSTS